MDILDIGAALKKSVAANQGAENFGKILAVGEDGKVVPVNGSGAEVITADDVLYSGSATYDEGTVGETLKETAADVSQLKSDFTATEIIGKTIQDIVISGSSKKWATYANSEFVIYPVKPGDEINIITGLTATYYTVLTDDDVTVGTLPNYATGYTGTVTVGSSASAKFKIPSDGKYIVVFYKSGGAIVSPTSIINDLYDYTSSLKTNLTNVSDRVSNAKETQTHTFAKRRPMVTFIDDDGNVEFYTYLLPMMRTYGIPMVSAYMGDANPDMQSNAAMMTKAQCDEVVAAGGELIVHYNTDATTITIEQAESMMLKSKSVLEKYGFNSGSNILAYSNGTSNTDIREMVSKHFDCALSGAYPRVSATDRSNHGCIVQYAIHREPCGGLYYDNSPECATLPYFTAMIDECVTANGWLVFVLHSWLMPPEKQQGTHTGIDQFGLLEGIIEYIQTLQQGGSDIEIVTASKGFETFGNAWQAGDYLGYWNEQILTDTPTLGDHSLPGCAMNKLGQYDFPVGNNITPQST